MTPTDREKEMAGIAVKMLVYCSALYMSYLELADSLRKEGRYKHRTKVEIKRLIQTSYDVYRECCRVFQGEDSPMCDRFGEMAGELMVAVKENVGFSGSEKWYQIACSLSVLIEHKNRLLEDVYYFRQAEYLYDAERRLKGLGYTKNKAVEIIISYIEK